MFFRTDTAAQPIILGMRGIPVIRANQFYRLRGKIRYPQSSFNYFSGDSNTLVNRVCKPDYIAAKVGDTFYVIIILG